MQGITISVDLYVLPLRGLDIVLGVQWLEKLGKVMTDYKEGTMQFAWGDGSVTLQTRIDEQPKEIGLKSLARLWERGAQCYAVRVQPTDHSEHENLVKCTLILVN